MQPSLTLYGRTFSSHLLLGSAQYPSLTVLRSAIASAQPAMVTVALRRLHPATAPSPGEENHFLQFLQSLAIPLLPNTAGCYDIDTAITTAHMARELFNTEWIKLELIGDAYTLQPDMEKMIPACKALLDDGFKVLPYCTDDLIACRRLVEVGCLALMPWAAPIGSGKGPLNPFALKLLRARLPDIALIVDAGLGLPSHAAQVMEWGFDGVLVNSAVSASGDPVAMARAFALAVESGKEAYHAGAMPERDLAVASTPTLDTPFWQQATH